MIEVTPELLARHDRPGPRYTSYPTAIEFSERYRPTDHEERLALASTRPENPLSLYVHLPFCAARCSFCACHVVVARRPEISSAYLDRVVREARLVADRLGARRRLAQYHWGGGTPTHHPPDALARLHAGILESFEPVPDAELGVEVDPRVTSPEHLATLAELGFNRLSLGVQDLDAGVQALIGRHQTPEQTERLHRQARSLGFRSINLDLVYGLPGQDEETFAATLATVIALRPDRLAVYSFAYVPWMRPHQRRIDPSLLPSPAAKLALCSLAITTLRAAGYRRIGMDHFALPDDELSLAADRGLLTRTFMGYTTRRGTEVVGLGTSGISDLAGAYAQDHRRLASYYEAVDAGRLPTERGVVLDPDDLVRRAVIDDLMCNGRCDLVRAAAPFGVDGPAAFQAELDELLAPGGLVDEGLATVDDGVVRVTELGSLFIRRVAAVFDAHAPRRAQDRPVFSRTV